MIYLILIFGILLRLISLDQSLWLDEAITAEALKNFSFWQLILEFTKYDFHPPGHYLVLWGWVKLFGLTEVALRLPSVLMGVMTIFGVYLIGKEVSSKKVGLLAAWFLAINSFHLYYSQEVRVYVMATLAVVINYYFFQKILAGRFSWGYVGSVLLVLISDYVAYFSFVGQLVIICWWYRNRLKHWLISLVPGGLLFGLWSPVFIAQVMNGSELANALPVWQKVVGGFELKSLALVGIKTMFGRISLDNKLLYLGLIIISGVIYLAVICRAIVSQRQVVKNLLVMLIIPVMTVWLGSLIMPIFSYFRVLFVVPFISLILAIGVNEWRKWGVVSVILISVISMLADGVYLTQSKFQREDWRGVVSFLSQEQKSDAVVILESDGSFAPYEYYGGDKVGTFYGLKKFPAKDEGDLNHLEDLGQVNKVYLLEYLVDIADPNRLVEKNLIRMGFKEGRVTNFNGVGFVREFVR